MSVSIDIRIEFRGDGFWFGFDFFYIWHRIMERPKKIDTACKDIGILKRDFQDMKVTLLEIKEMLHALRLRLDAHEEKHKALVGGRHQPLPDPTEKIGGGWFF